MKTCFRKLIRDLAVRCAGKLNTKLAGCSRLQQQILLLLFCLLFSAISIFTLVNALLSKKEEGFPVQGFVRTPAHIGKTNEQPVSRIPARLYERVELFKKKLDSMATTDPERYRQILYDRPHLLDSIALLEKLYSPSKK